MDFLISEEQTLIEDTVKRLIEKDYDFEQRKKFIASPSGMSEAVWAQLAEMGVLALPYSEDKGGFNSGAMGLLGVMESVGQGLLLEPLMQTWVCGRIIESLGSEQQQAQFLPSLLDGSHRMALAHGEPQARYEVADIAVKAESRQGAWVLNGLKSVVVQGPVADQWLVTARTSGKPGDTIGISIFVIDATTAGVTVHTERTVDNLRSADISFKDVSVSPSALLGAEGQAFEALDAAIDFASVLLGAEAVGAMKFANATTLEYLKTRKQFGTPIGSFQALQHRMVEMTISARQASSAVLLAANAFDQYSRGEIDAKQRRRFVAAARIKVADAARQVGQEAIQLHGGMGMTQEMKVSHTFKRLTMITHAFGDIDYFLDRFSANS
jgi:alkylation response protein AidB-like acyl-CoA dehydrogenase